MVPALQSGVVEIYDVDSSRTFKQYAAMNSLLRTIADEIIAVYPAGQFEQGSDDRFARVVGPTASFVLSQTAEDFYVARVGNGRQMIAHQYKPESNDRMEHLHKFVERFV